MARASAKFGAKVEARISITKTIESLSHRHSTWQVFSDFLEMAAISISNSVDHRQAVAREARYMTIVKGYKPDEIAKFPQMLGELCVALEEKPDDILGRVFHELELHNKYAGQFFTPFVVCQMMGQMTADPEITKAAIADRGFITAMEPACGSGAMIIALADALRADGVNYQQQLHVHAIDIDLKCVHMAYLQFALLGIPAVIIHGDALSNEEWGHWYTPQHVLGGWARKLRPRFEAVPELLPEPIHVPAPLLLPPPQIIPPAVHEPIAARAVQPFVQMSFPLFESDAAA